MTSSAPTPRSLGAGVVGLMLAAVLVPLNSTMLAVALPEISSDLDVSKGTSGALVVVYLLVMLVGQPLGGRAGDRLGYQRAIFGGLLGVAAASIAAALTSDFGALVAARGLQAVFASLLVPNAQAMLRASTPPAHAGRMFGLFGSMIGVGAAIGPLVGGAVTTLIGWQAVFLVNLPVIMIAVVLGWRLQEPSHDERHAVPAGGPGRIWNRSFNAAFSTQALTTFGQYTLILVVPVLLDDRGWSAGAIGAAVTSLTIGMVVMGPIGGSFGDRHGRRRPAALGVSAACIAVTVTAVLGEEIAMGLLVAALTAYGFGFGFAAPSLMTTAVESAPVGRTATASGLFSTARYTGSIPASLLFATAVGADTGGIATTLAAASCCAAVAVVCASFLPGTGARQPDARPIPVGRSD